MGLAERRSDDGHADAGQEAAECLVDWWRIGLELGEPIEERLEPGRRHHHEKPSRRRSDVLPRVHDAARDVDERASLRIRHVLVEYEPE
jgi:hypothetical protein